MLCQTELDNVLGDRVGRAGWAPNADRIQAIRDFAPLKDVKHVQQFNGSHIWIRNFMPVEYGSAAKVLGEFRKPTATVPPEGLGAVPLEKKHPGDLAVRAIRGWQPIT